MTFQAVLRVSGFSLAAACLTHAASSINTAGLSLDSVLHGVEHRYNGVKTLRVRFTEKYVVGDRPKQTDSGILILRKPGRMRWDYETPAGKWFLADGNYFYLWTPGSESVERSRLRDSEDARAPLAFLLGHLDFYKEFRRFSAVRDGGDTTVTAEPQSERLPYRSAAFTLTPQSRIRALRITNDDGSVLEFVFENEELNPSIPPARFDLRLPPGATLEDLSQ